jgi:hypothetical protein
VIGVLGGMIGLGGVELRLSLLIGLFGFAALQVVILNKAMGLIAGPHGAPRPPDLGAVQMSAGRPDVFPVIRHVGGLQIDFSGDRFEH